VIESDTRLRRNPQVVYRALADEGGVLLRLDSAQYHGVNSTGLAIWELLDGERTVAEVVAELRARLDEPPDVLDEEVVEFLAGLSARGLALD
jgi:pyrroloquinoline quinone biosynthesis protein D